MLRCVVTGQQADGKSVFVADGIRTSLDLALMPPETQFLRLWGADSTPALPTDGTQPDMPTFFPPAGGYRFVFFTLAPRSSRLGPIDDMDTAMAQMEAALPEMGKWMEPDNPGMHTTDTVDLDLIITGEVDLELDDGAEVHLRAGDCVVQNGTRHAWHNRTSEPMTMLSILVGAKRA